MLSHRLSNVKPSPTLAITSKAIALKAAGHNIISLSAGEPDYDTPNHIKNAAYKAIEEGKTKYTPVEGIHALKEAIVQKFAKENDIHYKTNQIIVSTGAKQVLFNALLATLNPLDEVIIPAPYWVSYVDMVELAEGTPIVIQCSEEQCFKARAEDIEKAITPATKWLILNSPNNPTGAVYTKQELLEIAQMLHQHPHVFVMTDDIYEHIIFDNNEFYTLAQIDPSLQSRILTVNGVSKSYSMTGWRIGYGAGPEEIISAMSIIQSQSTSNPCSISQYAALAALNSSQECVADGREIFYRRRNIVMNLVNQITGLTSVQPQGAFYLFINCKALLQKKTTDGKILESSDDFCSYLLEKALVATVPGEAFGTSGYIRISYATGDLLLQEAFDRIKVACSQLS